MHCLNFNNRIMATTKRELSQKVNGNGKSEIIIRLTIGRGLQPRLKSGLFVDPARFNDGKKDPKKAGTIIMPRANQSEAAELRRLESDLIAVEQYLLDVCTSTPKELISKEFLVDALDRYQHPEHCQQEEARATGFFGHFEVFLNSRNLSEWRIKHYKVLMRSLKRFEAYRAAETGTPYQISLDDFDASDVCLFEEFLRNEPAIAIKYPAIYEANPADTRKVRKTPKPQPKGDNTIVCTFSRLRAFFNWCNEQGLTENKPFAKYSGVSVERYGTPYYITIEERDQIADFDLSNAPDMETQRDIFVFHCLIGCRVSDLMRLTPANIINGAVEYIASKTKGERPEVIRVPLHHRALELVEKYAGAAADGRLFPFISPQRYNDAIKRVFATCGITRTVTILNPTTGEEEQRPLNEIASSHIARRTFVGNLYKQVKDPNLVGKLSGHKEGSRAFARYRDIDEDMKRELINLLGCGGHNIGRYQFGEVRGLVIGEVTNIVSGVAQYFGRGGLYRRNL